MRRRFGFLGLYALSALVAATAFVRPQTEPVLLPTGKAVTPIGEHVGVGSFPVNMILYPPGRYAVVTNSGFRQFLTVVRVADGKITDQIAFPSPNGLYYGLALGAGPREATVLYVSHGARDRISRWVVSGEGKLSRAYSDIVCPAVPKGSPPYHPAGVAVSADGTEVYVANNLAAGRSDFKGSFSIYGANGGTLQETVPTAGFPLAIASVDDPHGRGYKVYVSSERDGCVTAYRAHEYDKPRTVKTGAQPSYMLSARNSHRLYVSNAGSDTVSVVDTASYKVLRTILLRPVGVRGLPGATPLGMALSPDERRLYVALADMNALAVVDPEKGSLLGYIPTGWYPTSVVAGRDGRSLLIASAKGVDARIPNARPVRTWGTYVQNIIEGTVSRVEVPGPDQLTALTQRVLENNRVAVAEIKPEDLLRNPGIKHVIYIVKENRTYDQVLGDLPQGNGDPERCMFPRAVTPNQHALAERFALLDNFYVCAEVSYDGWCWSTSGMTSAYTSRNAPYNYSGRGRGYDSEGENNGVPVDLKGIPDVARPTCGYIWDHCLSHGLTVRNFGVFVGAADPKDKRYADVPGIEQAAPNKRALIGRTCPDFRWFDTAYADSDAWVKYGVSFPAQLRAFGASKATCRFAAWKAEFDDFVKAGQMPAFQILRFPQDHTAGSRAGFASPRAEVADNDYAVGLLVDAVSHSLFWKDTLICIVEDDAQNGVDHVDCHRSPVYLISPFIAKGAVDGKFYNTDSVLRTMELVLGLPPMSQYDAVARPFAGFSAAAVNAEPFEAILPARAIIAEVNTRSSRGAAESVRLFPRFVADAGPEDEQNQILWTAVMGPNRPMPAIRRGIGSKAGD